MTSSLAESGSNSESCARTFLTSARAGRRNAVPELFTVGQRPTPDDLLMITEQFKRLETQKPSVDRQPPSHQSSDQLDDHATTEQENCNEHKP